MALGVWMWRNGHLSFSRSYPCVRCSPSRIVTTWAKRGKRPERGAPQGGLTVLPAEYPSVPRDESVVEELHGVQIADPYRWIEDPDSQATREFVTNQNRLTRSVLAKCDTKKDFEKLFKDTYNYPKHGCPFIEGKRIYYFYNTGLQSHQALYTMQSLSGDSKVFLDPNSWSKDGSVALSRQSFSENGEFVAYTTTSGGSDWETVKVAKVGPGGEAVKLGDKLEYVKFSSLSWSHDNKGFFYCRFPKPQIKSNLQLGQETDANKDMMVAYHVVGTPQEQDYVVLAMPETPLWMFQAQVTDDGKYLLLYPSLGTYPGNKLYYAELDLLPRDPSGALDFSEYDFFNGTKKLPIVKLIDTIEGSFEYVSNEGPIFTFHTNYLAPRYKVVRTDFRSPGSPKTWKELIPQHEKEVLEWAAAVKGDNMLLCYLKDCANVLELRSLETGRLKTPIALPGIGSIGSFTGKRKLSQVFFSFSSFTEASAIYQFDVTTPGLDVKLFKRTEIPGLNPDDFVTEQVFVTSKDGTQVPMFVTHKKGIQMDGQNPTLLYGYGGFNISLLPSFSVGRLCFMRAYNAVYASANLRGGGEYGISWRNAGSTKNKQNVFDDFQACAEYLINEKYTASAKLAIRGGSNGGLLVAACANQRPDLFGCVVSQVGVLDMLRFQKFTIGSAWIPDYGDPDKTDDFEFLLPYSPVHNVQVPADGTQQYPAMLLTTGDHDDRVSPFHTLKMLATLQHVFSSDRSSHQKNALVARIEEQVGHGAGRPTEKIIDEETDIAAFMAAALQAKWAL